MNLIKPSRLYRSGASAEVFADTIAKNILDSISFGLLNQFAQSLNPDKHKQMEFLLRRMDTNKEALIMEWTSMINALSNYNNKTILTVYWPGGTIMNGFVDTISETCTCEIGENDPIYQEYYMCVMEITDIIQLPKQGALKEKVGDLIELSFLNEPEKIEDDSKRMIWKKLMERKACPCCGYFTVENDDIVNFDICEVCSWQYDEAAHRKPDTMLGANAVTLYQARENFKSFGVSEKRFIGKGRKPLPEELPENNR